jgi:hypothetical protein
VYRLIACLTICCAAARSRAQDPGSATAPVLFPKGTWTIEATGAYAWEFYPQDHVDMASGVFGVGYYLRDNFAISLLAPVYWVRQRDSDDAFMYGLNLSLRYHFYQHERFTLFGDLIGGLAQANHNVPPGGSYFNFTLQGGVGATFKIVDHVHLQGGVRIFHLSNAATHGISRNPDLNAVQGYAGFIFSF